MRHVVFQQPARLAHKPDQRLQGPRPAAVAWIDGLYQAACPARSQRESRDDQRAHTVAARRAAHWTPCDATSSHRPMRLETYPVTSLYAGIALRPGVQGVDYVAAPPEPQSLG